MQKNKEGYDFDRSGVPYDAMGDYSVFAHRSAEMCCAEKEAEREQRGEAVSKS